ncbi:MAG TPA: phenylalanine--tRNA ligase subunit beta [Bryobacteraceae bacterium]|nr:phenylalanine--tRNA ligase subunit beta [Bryobacteraceae bacterium]
MKFSYNWLREMVDGLTTSANELERLMTIKTAECEGVEEIGAALAGASEALVVVVEPMGASHNRRAVVETIRYGQKTVVCGAPDCRVGMRTVYLQLGKKRIEGVESDGMLASAKDLGIGRDHTGIIELSEPFTLTPDQVIEVDNKSLTHRPDLWGHYGMAREVAAITGNRLRDPVRGVLPDAPAAIRVTVEDFALCPRYSALVFENVTIQPSPLWLQYRLEAIGLNPISNIVDVTNFVMAELTQPMHAFDADKLHGEIIVRTARQGERFAALNGESYDLDPSNLVIADPAGAVALAGVIGGADSAISDTTTRIVLESACFHASSVRKTSSRIRLRTDASMRFEKSQDPANTNRGLKRAWQLLQEVSPGIRLVGGLADAYRPLPAPVPIVLHLDWLDRKLGRAIPAPEVRKILESLEFRVDEIGAREFRVHVPSWRATKDVTIKDDLVEEVGRMIGYGNITPAAPLAPARVPPANPERAFHHRVREMAAAQGFTEVYNYSFVSEEQARAFGLKPEDHVQVANPIAADQNLLRSNLLAGIWKNIVDNARHFDTFRLFEIGREIHKDGEIPHFAAAIYAKDDGVAGLLELKRVAECLLAGIRVQPAKARAYEHPQRAADVYNRETLIGRLFEFHPRMVETGRAAVLDLDLTMLEKLQPAVARYQQLRRFPTSAFDVTVAVPARTLIGEIESAIPRSSEVLSLEFLREFALPDGRRSLSFRITAGAADRTLSSEETGAIRTSIIDALTVSGYESRS